MSNERDILEVMQRLYYRGLNMSQSGNASIKLDDSTIAITPASIDKPSLKEDGISYLKLPSGELNEGPRQSSEYLMHVKIYNSADDITAIVHAHPPYLLALADSIGVEKLRLSEDQEGSIYVGSIGLVDGKTGTLALAEEVAKELSERNATAVVMKGHGVTSISLGTEDIYDALNRIEVIENLAMRRVIAYMLGK